MKDAAVLCAFSSGKAKRRVFVQLLRLLKIRYAHVFAYSLHFIERACVTVFCVQPHAKSVVCAYLYLYT